MGLDKLRTPWPMTGMVSGLVCQNTADWGFGLDWARTDPLLGSKPGLLAGYLDP
jgi:hypothetical protein